MGKRLIIKGADFSTNAIDGGVHYREGTIIENIWDSAGSQFLGNNGFKVVAFPVIPGEQYSMQTDRSSSSFAFAATVPAAGVPYVGGSRTVFYSATVISGVVPEGASYIGIGMYTMDAGNLFPSEISIGDDIVNVSEYR